MNSAIRYVLYVGLLVALSLPLGFYISMIMGGERTIVSQALGPVERGIYKLLHIDPQEDMSWKRYLASALLFNLMGFFVLFLILLLQGHLPWNPQGFGGLSWHLAFSTAVSFVTNTNWQTYSGEVTLSNFSQAMGLTVQNFVSAASGIAVLYALIRGLVRTRAKGIGSFWQDLPRCTLYILLPICLVSTLVLTSQGVPQTLGGNRYVDLVEPIAIDAESSELRGAAVDLEAGTVTVDGEAVPDAQIVTQQVLPLYPQASQVSMKQLGTNGGGMIPMLLMMLGEVVFGGVGCGLYGMIGFVILTVFIAGLMVGRTPEYLGKKIEPREMRMAVLLCLATPIAILIGSGIACLLPATADALNNAGAHGLSEVLYNYASAGGNNGSAFAGMNNNTPFLNTSLGLVMLFVRLVPVAATVTIAGSMAAKRRVAESAGTLSTCNALFVVLLILMVLIVGALSFFPALSLGPIAEYTQMIGLS